MWWQSNQLFIKLYDTFSTRLVGNSVREGYFISICFVITKTYIYKTLSSIFSHIYFPAPCSHTHTHRNNTWSYTIPPPPPTFTDSPSQTNTNKWHLYYVNTIIIVYLACRPYSCTVNLHSSHTPQFPQYAHKLREIERGKESKIYNHLFFYLLALRPHNCIPYLSSWHIVKTFSQLI